MPAVIIVNFTQLHNIIFIHVFSLFSQQNARNTFQVLNYSKHFDSA